MSRQSTPLALIRWVLIAVLVITIELVCRLELIKPHLLVPPSVMAEQLLVLMGESDFWSQVRITCQSIAIAFASAVIVGFVLGTVLHRLPPLRRAVEPLIASWYALPFFVLYPMFIVLFGMNEIPIVVVGFLYALMAVVSGTLSGLDRIPQVLTKVGKTLHLSCAAEAILIKLPAAAPHIFTGSKLALGYAVTGVIGSEFILSNQGLGYTIAFAYNNFDDRTMYAMLLFVIVLVSALTAILDRFERRVQHRAGSGQQTIRQPTTDWRERIISALAITLCILAAWELIYLRVGSEALAPPGSALLKLASLHTNPEFLDNVSETATALGMSLLISCVGGLVLGIIVGMSRAATAVLEPIFVTVYSVPKVTLYPVVLLFFGIGLAAKVAFGTLYGLIPMLLITMSAIRNMNPILLKTAKVMKLGQLQLFGMILLPATVPELATGLRISFSITLLGVMIGEMFASRRGLGFMIMNSIAVNDTATLMALTVLTGLFALTANSLLLALDHKLHRL